jgi:competence protein ComEC
MRIILLDVGWGDSIIIESEDSKGKLYYGLIDCNDTSTNLATFNFFKRRLGTKNVPYSKKGHVFDFVLLTHDHADHSQGLKGMMREFGTKWFWYPKEQQRTLQASLMAFANRSKRVENQQALDNTVILPDLGDVSMKVLWPAPDYLHKNQNNNSVVLLLTLGEDSFLLTGDAEADVWSEIADQIPENVKFFKVPHHGSVNGSFDKDNAPAWLKNCPSAATLGISCWKRFGHPHKEVLDLFINHNRQYLRTDIHYHIIAETDGKSGVNLTYHR